MAEALLDEHRLRYNLASLLVTYHLPPKEETLLREAAAAYGCDPKADLWRLPARFVGAYAEGDVVPLLDIYRSQHNAVVAQGLEKVVKLEHDLVPLLLEMRFRGVRVATGRAEELLKEFDAEYEGHRQEIFRLTGYLPDVWAAESCAVAMDKAGIHYNQTSTGKPSFTDEWLSGHEHQVPKLITLARKAYKAGQTFCKNYVLDHADKKGRVHAEFNPLRTDDGGTVSGRFSSARPNLQNIPARDPEMGTKIRGLFLPEEGEEWCAADWSQQEPRLTIHYAAVNNLTNAEAAVQRYRDNPDTDYHQMTADLAGITRKKAKPINLGLAYGMGGAKLARSLGLPTAIKVNSRTGRSYEVAGPEAQEILDKYHAGLPFIKELTDKYSRIAETEGQIRTLSGRLCRFPYWEPKNGGRAMLRADAVRTYGSNNIKRSWCYTAMNRKIQGGSADLIKIAMRQLWREGLVPLVTVHDEIGISVPDRQTALRVVDIMRHVVPLRVPLRVDCDMGASWGIASPIVLEEEEPA
jgi:DNA polymerase I-like protein with 3'-5' exonuclease and polymerase domains